ncbi:hypothetical protein Taro_015944 [Colocasia esculenta]|uniref:Uncharacterized protein n=1 Tax=Colocasia esculenta TaxID=4460 RepID=A0A843UNQ2_COLES|nr:hypothetical protein [Colocasia esculenta]
MYIHRHQLHRQEGYRHSTRRGRGPSRVTSVRILPLGQTFPIDLEGGSSVGPYSQHFTIYLGVCNRVHCNLWQQDYMTLPLEKKETILRDLQVQKEGRHPTHMKMFQMTQARTTPDGSVMWSNEQSRHMMDQMIQFMNPTPSDESDGMTHLAVLSLEEAFRQVFGRDRLGWIRCGGRGQTLRSWYEPSEGGSRSNTAYQRLLEDQSQ